MKYRHAFFLFLFFATFSDLEAHESQNYFDYHAETIGAEVLITREAYAPALEVYDRLFEKYDFVFLRDVQIATQLAVQLKKEDKAFKYLKKGIASGWRMKAIKKNKFLAPIRRLPEWNTVVNEYASQRATYEQSLDTELRDEVYQMYKKDQRMALGGLFRFGNKSRDRYADRKFAPHDRAQMAHFLKIMDKSGFPGERSIGNRYCAEAVLVHHNSMTTDLANQDTIYPQLRPRLLSAIGLGQLSPCEFAIIDNWYIAVKSERKVSSYGNLEGTIERGEKLNKANELRKSIGLRSVETRNDLIDIQQKTGMSFYLPEWPQRNRKIEVLD